MKCTFWNTIFEYNSECVIQKIFMGIKIFFWICNLKYYFLKNIFWIVNLKCIFGLKISFELYNLKYIFLINLELYNLKNISRSKNTLKNVIFFKCRL